MRLLIRIAQAMALAVALLASSEWAMRKFDPATPDERAVLTAFIFTIQDQDCIPARTSVVSEHPRDRRWVEVDDAEAARLEAAGRQAEPRNLSLFVWHGWMWPVFSSALGSGHCRDPIRIGTPAIVGDRAFVTAATKHGVTTSAFARGGPEGWLWASSVWDGEGITQY
ncbi:MAG TPA: hypothetical protein VGF77_01165 [Allosphingosinicella sp.]|jgi:hypothetical protein